MESTLAINDDDTPGTSGSGGAPYLDANGDVDYIVLDEMLWDLIYDTEGLESAFEYYEYLLTQI